MADIRARFVYDADFSSSISQIKLLARELSVLNNSFNSLDKDARKTRNQLAELFKGDVGDLGAFTARTVDITSSIDNFGTALDRNKLKLRDYGREARKAFQANSNARKLAEDQVRRTKADLVDLGMDANGRRKGILVTPLKLDMSDMQTQIEVARKQFSIFNKLVNDGATQLINWGKNTQWAGRQLTVGLTVPMTMFATATIKAFNDVDKELTRFQKVYGSDLVGSTKEATNAIRQQVQALAVDIAGAYGVAAKETAGLAADLAATGLEGQKLLDSIKQTTRLSVLGEIDRQDAMKTTLSLQNAFNMSTQELAESINFLNAVENQTSLSLQDLTEAIPKVGPVVRALGGDVKDLSVLMVAMKEGGINAAEGANALKSGLASLINPTKAGSEVAKQYGIDLEDIVKRNKGQLLPTVLEFQKSMQTLDDLGKAKIIEQLFGKYQFARISALFDNLNTQGSQTKQVIELMSASNSDLAKIANEEIKTLTESASMRFQRSMEAIKAALLPVGEAIVNSVLPFMERFAGVLDRVVAFAKELPAPVKSFLKVITGLTAVAGPIIMMAGVLGNFSGYIIKGAMAFVNLGRRIRGLPTEKFQLLDDTQIAASKATDTLTISIARQRDAMVGLNKVMMDYQVLLMKQRSATPGLFNDPMDIPAPATQSRRPNGRPGPTRIAIRRQKGGSAWVPGSGSGDKIPALLEPGEFVINRNAAKQYGGVLENMNNGVPRFQSGGKIPGYMSGFTGKRMGARAAKIDAQQAAATPRPNAPRPIPKPMQDLLDSIMAKGGTNTKDDSKDPKMFDPAELTGVLYGENRAINDVFVRGDKETRKIILDKIVSSENLTESDKMRILGSLDSETNLVSLEDRRKLANELDDLWSQGSFENTSVGQQIKIATMIEAPRYGIKDAQTFSQVDPTLEPKLGRGPNNRSNPFSPSVTRQSLLRGFGETDEDSLLRIQEVYDSVKSRVTARPTSREIREQKNKKKLPKRTVSLNTPEEQEEEFLRLLDQIIYGRKATFGDDIYGDAAHMYMYQSGGPIKAIRGIKMPETYATKLATIRQSMANTNKEAMSSNVPLIDIGTRQSRIGGHSSAIPGVNGVYEINGQRYVVKGHDTYESAKAEADMARITREVFGLQTPNQEAVRIRHPETGDLMFAVRSQYDDMFATSTGRFSEGSVFNQIIAAAVRRDKDLQAGNLWDNVVADVGQAGIMNRASQPRTKTGATNSVLEQLAINLGMVKGGARSHGAEGWNSATAKMSDEQIARGIKQAAQEAKSKITTADIPEDFAYIARDLDDILSSDLGPFIAHLRTVTPKVKKPPTEAAIAKKEQQKLLDREERQAALDAGYPQWAMQSGGILRAQNGAWVPGKGEGDRVPAMLEPGEFVVNKKAAKQYGGMLENINWNIAPRFNEGGDGKKTRIQFNPVSSTDTKSTSMQGRMPGQMPGMAAGAVSGGLMAASMASSMMLPVNKFTDALNKSIMALSAFTGILSAMQMLGVNMGGGFGKKMSGATMPKAGSKASALFDKGAGKVATGKADMAMSGVGNKLKGARALSAGKALMGVGRTAALMTNPVGWAIAATMAVTAAVVAYKKALDSAKKAAQQVFGASKAEAEAFGVEIRSVADAIKANQEYTKQIGAQAQQSQFSTPGRLDPEKEAAVLGANEDLTGRLRNLGETRLGTTVGLFGDEDTDRSMQRTDLLTGKYASLLQQGFSEEDANIMVRTLAKASGAMESYYQAQQRFKSIKADDSASIVKAQMEALSTFNIDVIGGEEGAFAAGIKDIVSNLNLLPPEDQYSGLKELLTQIETLDTSRLKVAQQSLVDMAQENYGEDSQLAQTLAAIQDKTEGTGSILNPTSWDQFFGPEARNSQEQSTAVSAALTTAYETGVITDQQLETYMLKIDADPDSLGEIEQEIDMLMKARELKVKIDIEYKEQLDNELEANNKKIILEQQRMQDAMDAKEASMQKEQEAFKESQKAGQKYIKGKQDEIEAINKGTDKYIKSLEKRATAENFYQNQQKTALGGLSALASGDVFGFLESQRQMAQDSAQFGFDQEIEQIDEKRNLAVEGLQEEIDKKQEALELQAEAHEARMIQLEKEREQMAKNFAKNIADMQALSDGLAAIRGNDKILEWLNTINDPFAKAAQQAAIINYLITNPAATLEEAFKSVQATYNQNNPGSAAKTTASGGEHPSTNYPKANSSSPTASASPTSGGESKTYAEGGFVSGPGTPTSDSIPARLSDGEYVIKASSVEKFGKATFDSLNSGEPVAMYADGGFVKPTRSGTRGGNPYGIKKNYYSLGYHTGQDYKADVGDDILAVASGNIVGAGFSGSLGNLLTIQHANGIRTYYAHLSKILKRSGEVKKGDHVAEAGFSGNVIPKGPDGAHLHFEVRKSPYGFNNESILNPNSYLSGSSSVGGQDIASSEEEGEQERTRQEAISLLASSGEASVSDLTKLMSEGAASVYESYPGRRFGGSMTMNKPYLVGENGPEVVLPYGSGSRVDPSFTIPSASSGIIDGAGASSMSKNISIVVNGAKNPQEVAKYVVAQINKQDSRRDFGRSI